MEFFCHRSLRELEPFLGKSTAPIDVLIWYIFHRRPACDGLSYYSSWCHACTSLRHFLQPTLTPITFSRSCQPFRRVGSLYSVLWCLSFDSLGRFCWFLFHCDRRIAVLLAWVFTGAFVSRFSHFTLLCTFLCQLSECFSLRLPACDVVSKTWCNVITLWFLRVLLRLFVLWSVNKGTAWTRI